MRVTGLQEALALASWAADKIEQVRNGRDGPEVVSLMVNVPGRQITLGMASFEDFERAARLVGALRSTRTSIVSASKIMRGWALTLIGPVPEREPAVLVDITSVDE